MLSREHDLWQGRDLLLHLDLCHGPHGGQGAGGSVAEALEVMFSDEEICRLLHPFCVQVKPGIGGIARKQRIRNLAAVDPVDIGLLGPCIPGVEGGIHLPGLPHDDVVREPRVQRVCKPVCRNSGRGVEDAVVAQRVDTGVGAACADDFDLLPGQVPECLVDLPLDRRDRLILLRGKAAVVRPVIGQDQHDPADPGFLCFIFHVLFHPPTSDAKNPGCDAAGEEGTKEDIGAGIPPLIDEGLHLRPAVSPVVAPCLHRHCQVIGSAEGGDEQRHEQRNHGLDLVDEVPGLKVRTSCHLCLHDLVRLLHEDRDEPEGDGHHHGDLVHRNVDLLQGAEHALQRIGQLVRGRGQRHQGRGDDKEDQAHCHLDGEEEALPRNRELPERDESPARRQEQVEQHGDEKQHHDGLHAAQNVAHGNPGEQDADRKEHTAEDVSRHGIDDEQDDDVGEGSKELDPGVQPVHDRLCLIVLAKCDVLKHSGLLFSGAGPGASRSPLRPPRR